MGFYSRNFVKEFYDVVKEARKVFERFNMLGSCVDVVGSREKMRKTELNGEEIKIPTPFKLVAMHEAIKKNLDWIVPENPFDESSEPKSTERGSSRTYLDEIPCLVEDISGIDLNASSFENT